MMLSGITFLWKWLVWLFTLHISCSLAQTTISIQLPFQFTQPIYNASIYENSVGKIYVQSTRKMGIPVRDSSLDVSFSIIKRDDDSIFKLEELFIEDFWFLRIRTNTGILPGKLNRELHDHYTLYIKAMAQNLAGLIFEADAIVYISVLDRNDLMPIFYNPRYNITLSEDTAVHKRITRVSASDADIGINAEIYYSFVEATNTFAIHPTTGVITLTRPLNYQERSEYELEILASDRGHKISHSQSMSRGRAKLFVTVQQVNLYPPEFSVENLPSLVEHGNIGTVYAIVRIEDQDTGNNGKLNMPQIIDGDPNGYFMLKAGKSREEFLIIVQENLDREDSPDGFNLTLYVSDQGTPSLNSTIVVPVDIQDMNDNSPVFSQAIYEASIDETALVNSPVIFIKAGDADAGKNAKVHYTITGGNVDGYFQIDPISGLITTASVLDAETVSDVELEVCAEDEANSGARKSGAAIVHIDIKDCNDNTPVFNSTGDIFYVDENSPISSIVGQVTATDIDKDENGYFSLTIANINKVPFEIEPFAGHLKLTQVLDYESMKDSYILKIRASDWGSPFRREAETQVTVKVRDVNDNKPQFESLSCMVYVSSDIENDTALLVVSAIDLDITSIVSYSIDKGNEKNYFSIHTERGDIFLSVPTTELLESKFTLAIGATDGIHAADPMEMTVVIVNKEEADRQLLDNSVSYSCQKSNATKVLEKMLLKKQKDNESNQDLMAEMPDEYRYNINPPEFAYDMPTNITIREDKPVTFSILEIPVSDSDPGYNGKLTYVLSKGNEQGKFSISNEGKLYILSELDREKKDNYELVITAADLGKPSKTASRNITVTVLDVNDCSPVFERNHYAVNVSENINLNATITQVYATDDDTGQNSEIRYTIISDTDEFKVDNHSGIIRVNALLDRERQEVYNVLVQASDKGSEISLSSTTTVTIHVTDINDNLPKFSPEIYDIKIREDLPIGAVVTTLTAYDPDLGSGGEVTYSLIYGTDGKFEIDEITGTVRVSQKLDFEQKQVYNITAQAQDNGDSPLLSSCFINIEVIDVNENLYPPVFSTFVAIGYVREDEPIGTAFMQVSATDADAPEDDLTPIMYSIRDGSGLGRFTIDNNGTIRTAQVLDRETVSHYWLTVYAQDKGLVPLYGHQEVLIRINDTNDNVPQTEEPLYNASIPENSGSGIGIIRIQAYDLDTSLKQNLTFAITGGNSERYFSIDSLTGQIFTASRKLNRESKEEHILTVTVKDNGVPNLSSSTQVIVHIEDENDHAPEFINSPYRLQVPASPKGTKLFRVMAKDIDVGNNAEITYSIKKRKVQRFMIDPTTGIISCQEDLIAGSNFEFIVKATDHGSPALKSTTKVKIKVVKVKKYSTNPPLFNKKHLSEEIMENDRVGKWIVLVQAFDMDRDKIWYSIEDGNEDHTFSIGPEDGMIFIARKLNWEVKNHYNLTIKATDGQHQDFAWLEIKVLDVNDNPPIFDKKEYIGQVYESVAIGKQVLQVSATDQDNGRLFYSLSSATNPASKSKFHIDSETGVIRVKEKLDREVLARHELVVMVRDQGLRSKRNMCRAVIMVLDNNDHSPEFLSDIFEGRVFETAAIGTSVLQVVAADQDKGINAEIRYSILSGNTGGAFAIDDTMGTITVAKQLDREGQSDYVLSVLATDFGSPQLSSTGTVHVSVTISNNAPPKFPHKEYVKEIPENEPVGVIVSTVVADSRSSVVYSITSGDPKEMFRINPNSGVLSTNKVCDYEEQIFYNLTVTAMNIIGRSTSCSVLIHIIDKNDNNPVFEKELHHGFIIEQAPVGSIVLNEDRFPLVIKATDADSGMNSLLQYEIVENKIQSVFSVDSNTGAIRTASLLDHEVLADYEFTVRAFDLGRPHLLALESSRVKIHVLDTNDSPPKFSQDVYNVSLLLPTFREVAVLALNATDPDTEVGSKLTYKIDEGNEDGTFELQPDTGVLYVTNDTDIGSVYDLTVSVSDGVYETSAEIFITVLRSNETSLVFTKNDYQVEVMENVATNQSLTVLQLTGLILNQHITFKLLNPNSMFTIGATSGVLHTIGKPFDREKRSSYRLVVEARDSQQEPRYARAIVHVEIADQNDNPPIFVNQPYNSVISVESKIGDLIKQISAVDKDIGRNKELSFRIVAGNNQSLFTINNVTGHIRVNKILKDYENQEFRLIVEAADNGEIQQISRCKVPIKIITKATPLFEKQFYNITVPENIELHSPILSLQAVSPNGQKLVYSITGGDVFHEFTVDFNTDMEVLGPCVVSVIDVLDYEKINQYNLTVRAADVLTGVYTEAFISINIMDVNDCNPEFVSEVYSVSVSEAILIGSSVVQVKAKDDDSGINKMIFYRLAPAVGVEDDTKYFQINPGSGIIHTVLQLDHEIKPVYRVSAVATDSGNPARSSSVLINIRVLDLNDNAPTFPQYYYDVTISDQSSRNQFVTKLHANDPDSSNANLLRYAIAGGNHRQTFQIDAKSGILRLSPNRSPRLESFYDLSISVMDGVFTSYTQVRINVKNSNNHAPYFPQQFYSFKFPENYPIEVLIGTLTAVDQDTGYYGQLSYSIISQSAQKNFRIDADTGELFSLIQFDREKESKYMIPVAAEDSGGRMGFTTVYVHISDQNDNLPQFYIRDYKASVYANSSIGTSIVQVKALDPDEGKNGEVVYSLYLEDDNEVMQLFAIDNRTGVLTVKGSIREKANQVYQFFVSATDQGALSLENNVPVEVVIMGDKDIPPRFQSKSHSPQVYHINEVENLSDAVCVVEAEGPEVIDYKMNSGYTEKTNNPPTFAITSEGRVRLIRSLDRERSKDYIITVQAMTTTTPLLVDQTEVQIHVVDINDNAPQFDSKPYSIRVAEDTKPGSVLIQVHAVDKDDGLNGEIIYRFADENPVWVSQYFTIDADTGQLMLVSRLDRETQDRYNLTIVAEDKGEKPLSSHSYIKVEVTDVNDEPPRFKQKKYLASVNEDAAPGTVIFAVNATDSDIEDNSRLTFHITADDPLGQFRISSTGDIIVNKMLDRETKSRYVLVVTVTDGKFVSHVKVRVDILDANDNDPICSKMFVAIFIKEDDAPSTFLKLFRAHDKDEKNTRNSRIQYHLSGMNSDMFSMGVHTGVLTIRSPLDREQQDEYHLTVHAVDGGGRSCTTDVLISVQDINDNAPQFSIPLRNVSIPEDAQINTLITRLTATDQDAGVSKEIKFRLKNPEDDFLNIDEKSGIISLAKTLDREVKDFYSVAVIAYDKGFPRMSSTATLNIHLLDVNDNPPEFEHTMYKGEVREDIGIGRVLQVLAASKDVGVNAEISYYIIAGNEQHRFKIDKTTGVLYVNKPLDHELTREYFLTIEARDGGTPSLSNTAVAAINVTDINDCPPHFSQDVYSIRLLESEPVGNTSLRIVAADADSEPNAMITYIINSGDIADQFDIEQTFGYLSIKSALDREKISSYNLEVLAVDSGYPQLTGTTTLSIEIQDINDCPPRFSQPAYSVAVQKNSLVEDRPTGFDILKFELTDDDLPPNGAPFSFDIISGVGKERFRVDNEGKLLTVRDLNQSIKDRYELTIRAFDSGSPPLYSDATVTIEVTEESTVPPKISNLKISINSYQDKFPGGIIGKVSAEDPDIHDSLKYSIVSSNLHLFDIHENDGRIIAKPGLDAGRYVIDVKVSDGRYDSYGQANVDVSVTTDEMVKNAVTIRLGNIQADDFLRQQSRNFIKVLKNELSVRARDIEIISLQPADISTGAQSRRKRSTSEDLDVLFAVRMSHNSFIRVNTLRRKVQNATPKIQSALNLKVMKVFSDVCEKDTCDTGSCIGFVDFDKENPIVTEIGEQSFVSLKYRYTYECKCLDNKCIWDPDPCIGHQCPHYKVCKASDVSGPQCACPEGKTGLYCDKDLPPDCAQHGCYHDNKPLTFAGRSFARWTLVDKHGFENRLSVSLRIKTHQKNANLMFASGSVDYSILELDNGMVQYRFECGSGVGRVQLPRKISDGEWHTIFVERLGKTATINLDGRYTAWSSAPGEHDVLNLGSNNIYFGAEVETFPNGYRNIKRGFEGCMEDLRLHSIRLPFTDRNAVATSQEFHKIEFNCKNMWEKNENDPCSNFPCLNGGRCIPSSHKSYTCVCGSRFQGLKCEVDTNPCADNPCLNGGTCRNNPVLPNDFWCKCVGGLKGRRCEYGHHCAVNPCRNGANCIEGPDKPICQCVGLYEGPLCQYESDKCANNPCKNGGTCYNGPGTYFCNCSIDTVGTHCEEILLPNISSNKHGITENEIFIIIGALAFLIVIVIILIAIRFWYQKKQSHRRILAPNPRLANNVIMSDPDDLKHSKLSNPDLHLGISHCPPSPQPPPVPNRPASYTPSNHDSSLNTLNNFDTVRNYGSAADQLENVHNIPVYSCDHLQTFSPYPRNGASVPPSLPPPPPSNSASDTDSIQKPTWELDYPNILENYTESERKNSMNLAKAMPIQDPSPLFHRNLSGRDTSSYGSPMTGSEEDLPDGHHTFRNTFGKILKDNKIREGYHWDTSDWAAPHTTLPNISEVPVKEILDSPSSTPQSNDSNTHVDDVNDADMDDMDNDSEYCGDYECGDNDDDNNAADFHPAANFHHFLDLAPYADGVNEGPQRFHPNFMPDFDQPPGGAALDNWPAPPGAENGNQPPHSDEEENSERCRLRRHLRRGAALARYPPLDASDYEHSTAAMADDMSVSVGGCTSTNVSCSDISGLCDIDDSDMNITDESDNDIHPVKFNSAHLHTQV
ncbi:protocadherin Fat 1 isoform X3 [Octopus vulgaris]|uniref:Protocadherin Fat 1 isoform X3 n=1 Tax=Octopus vulgaris TaxID=6645 RepID=A0AA36BEW1_OCTVU|nr:protocadherin Fat 1 isoform X3 [Octopus vulgaris]